MSREASPSRECRGTASRRSWRARRARPVWEGSTPPSQTLTSGFSLQSWERIRFSCVSHPVCGTRLRCPRTNLRGSSPICPPNATLGWKAWLRCLPLMETEGVIMCYEMSAHVLSPQGTERSSRGHPTPPGFGAPVLTPLPMSSSPREINSVLTPSPWRRPQTPQVEEGPGLPSHSCPRPHPAHFRGQGRVQPVTCVSDPLGCRSEVLTSLLFESERFPSRS